MRITAKKVEGILALNEEARNNDDVLVEVFCNFYWVENKWTLWSNIIRCRAKIQNELKKFLPTNYKVRIYRQFWSLSARIRHSYNPLIWYRYYKIKALYNNL